MPITNPEMKDYLFLERMSADRFYPPFLVDKLKDIFVRLCETIEREQPPDEAGLIKLTHAATHEINALAEEFDENNSELETVAREYLADEFRTIASAYNYDIIDVEDLIEPREW